MLFDRKNMTKSLMIILSIIFVFSITSDARPSNLKSPIRPPLESQDIISRSLESKIDTGKVCEYCNDTIYKGIDKIHSRTYIAGSRCYHCNRVSGTHTTKVYTRRKVSTCLNGCTYSTIEYNRDCLKMSS
ncbi:hypothetical protein [Tissierella sp.]|uniref:hypothetical protein n=1 Tax=Tissierella sp. TaxID=41274 RepID=UPI0028AF34B3|nr:hypothetical protein [Tissierella sp.]